MFSHSPSGPPRAPQDPHKWRTYRASGGEGGACVTGILGGGEGGRHSRGLLEGGRQTYWGLDALDLGGRSMRVFVFFLFNLWECGGRGSVTEPKPQISVISPHLFSLQVSYCCSVLHPDPSKYSARREEGCADCAIPTGSTVASVPTALGWWLPAPPPWGPACGSAASPAVPDSLLGAQGVGW